MHCALHALSGWQQQQQQQHIAPEESQGMMNVHRFEKHRRHPVDNDLFILLIDSVDKGKGAQSRN